MTLTGPGADSRDVGPATAGLGYLDALRNWQVGDTVVLDLDLPVRITEPDPRIDAVRGCVALERGPLVYCIESADLPPRARLEDVAWDPTRQPVPVPRPEIGDSVLGITLPVVHRRPVEASTPDSCTPDESTPDDSTPDDRTPDDRTPDHGTADEETADEGTAELTAGAIPYFAWANRRVEGMRVWIPR